MASGQRQTVNGVQTINLHGKNYVEVAERVHMVHEKKAVFSIVKSEPVNVADRWLWVAVIMVDDQQYIGNAEIKMNAPKNTPDGTNPFECGETSAIGRALAFAGFGSVESIASKDEIERGKPFANSEQVGNGQDQTTNTASRPQARTNQAQAPTKPAEQAPAQSNPQAKPIASIPTFNGVRNAAIKHLDEQTFEYVLKEFVRDNNLAPDHEFTPDDVVALQQVLAPMIREARKAS